MPAIEVEAISIALTRTIAATIPIQAVLARCYPYMLEAGTVPAFVDRGRRIRYDS
jgi:hypothetical protein